MDNNKKIMIGGIVAVIVIALLAVLFVYIPYVNEQNFNSALQNATVIESEISTAVAGTGAGTSTSSSDIAASSNHTRDVYANEVIPRFDKEIKLLNDSKQFAGGNKVKEDYIDYQIKRLELEKNYYNVKDWDDYSNAMANHEYSKAISATDHMLKAMNDSEAELKPVGEDIRNLLSSHPDFEKSIRGLSLNPKFYGVGL